MVTAPLKQSGSYDEKKINKRWRLGLRMLRMELGAGEGSIHKQDCDHPKTWSLHRINAPASWLEAKRGSVRTYPQHR